MRNRIRKSFTCLTLLVISLTLSGQISVTESQLLYDGIISEAVIVDQMLYVAENQSEYSRFPQEGSINVHRYRLDNFQLDRTIAVPGSGKHLSQTSLKFFQEKFYLISIESSDTPEVQDSISVRIYDLNLLPQDSLKIGISNAGLSNVWDAELMSARALHDRIYVTGTARTGQSISKFDISVFEDNTFKKVLSSDLNQNVIDAGVINHKVIIDHTATFCRSNIANDSSYQRSTNRSLAGVSYPVVFTDYNAELDKIFVAGQNTSFSVANGLRVIMLDSSLSIVYTDTAYNTDNRNLLVLPATYGSTLSNESYYVSGTFDFLFSVPFRFPYIEAPSGIFVREYAVNPPGYTTDTMIPYQEFVFLNGSIHETPGQTIIYGLYYDGLDIRGFLDVIPSPTTSVNFPQALNYFAVSPNPAVDYISLPEACTNHTVMAADGRVVLSSENYQSLIDVSQLNTGTYFLRLTVGQEIKIGKFIKQ